MSVLAAFVLLGALLPAASAGAGVTATGVGRFDQRVAVTGLPPGLLAGDEVRKPALLPLRDDLYRALRRGDISPARYALERARSLFRPARVERRFGEVAEPEPQDATLILRDLAVRTGDLRPAARQAARALLARPTTAVPRDKDISYGTTPSSRRCTAYVCVHWVAGDGPHSARSAWADTTAAEFGRVWRTVVDRYGYRAPVADGASADHGPDDRLDVYLAELGRYQTYGFCTSDDPRALRRADGRKDLSAFCVVDNDFASIQYGGVAPLNSLRATAAHEFFHTVQFAYDAYEDLWLMEGTAAWVEDEVYDGVNDNRRYLGGGPLTHPHRSLDAGVYDPWIFFRFMSEYFGTSRAPRPEVIRQVWQRADGARTGSPDEYSLQAVANVSASRRRPFRTLFADFGWLNLFAGSWYEEGRAYPSPRLPRRHRHTLTARTPGHGARLLLNHLSNRHVGFLPGRTLPNRRRLRVVLDLPDVRRGSAATVVVLGRGGRVQPRTVRLNRRGNGATTVRFTRSRVAAVVLTLTNASTRYRCRQGTRLSCGGRSLDDALAFRYTVRAIR